MIYFVSNGRRKAIKIGYSAEPAKRVGALQTASPDRLTLLGVCPGGMEEEKSLHERFAEQHIRGEWFEETTVLLETIKKLCDGYRLWGRCPRCGAPNAPLHEYSAGEIFACEDCDPRGMPKTLRQSKEQYPSTFRVPAGGGYRIVRKQR